MSLLQEIQNAVVDSNNDLASTLRRCRILAARLKNSEFTMWVQSELDGYEPSLVVLPGYRVYHCQSYGTFFGPFGRTLKNAPIPMTCVPENLREAIEKVNFGHGVRELEEMVTKSDGGVLRSPWPADFAILFGSEIYEDMNMVEAWRCIPKSTIVGILDTIRNRLLNFVLEIESAAPDAGEISSPALPPDKVGNLFQITIMGNVGNLAAGSSDFSQSYTHIVSQGDWKSMRDYLISIGIEESDIVELEEAIGSEPTLQKADSFGEKVSGWLGKMVTKAAQGAWEISTNAATNLLTVALMRYYGLSSGS